MSESLRGHSVGWNGKVSLIVPTYKCNFVSKPGHIYFRLVNAARAIRSRRMQCDDP